MTCKGLQARAKQVRIVMAYAVMALSSNGPWIAMGNRGEHKSFHINVDGHWVEIPHSVWFIAYFFISIFIFYFFYNVDGHWVEIPYSVWFLAYYRP